MAKEMCSFYLASQESRGDWNRIRCCSVFRSIKDTTDREFLWVEIDPPVIGQAFGFGGDDITDIFLTPRYAEQSVLPIAGGRVHVLIFTTNDNKMPTEGVLDPDNLTLAAWGEIYATMADAEADQISSDSFDP